MLFFLLLSVMFFYKTHPFCYALHGIYPSCRPAAQRYISTFFHAVCIMQRVFVFFMLFLGCYAAPFTPSAQWRNTITEQKKSSSWPRLADFFSSSELVKRNRPIADVKTLPGVRAK
jgi:hypothetical protein